MFEILRLLFNKVENKNDNKETCVFNEKDNQSLNLHEIAMTA